MKLSELKPGMEVAVERGAYIYLAIIVQVGGFTKRHIDSYVYSSYLNRDRVDPAGKDILVAERTHSNKDNWKPHVVRTREILSSWTDYEKKQKLEADAKFVQEELKKTLQQELKKAINELGCGRVQGEEIVLSWDEAKKLVSRLTREYDHYVALAEGVLNRK